MTINADGWRRLRMVDKIYHDHRRWVIIWIFMMMTMVVVVREDASVFMNRHRRRLVICLTFIRIFSKDTLMMMVAIMGERRSRLFAVYNRWSFGLTDPFIYCFFANDSLHHRITDRVNQRDGASVWASLTASLSLRPSTTFCFPQIPPCNYHIFTKLLCIHINSHTTYHLFLQLSIKWPKSNEPRFKGLKTLLCA